MSLFDDVRSEGAQLLNGLQPEFHFIAALALRDAKQVARTVAASAKPLASRDLIALKDMAVQIVNSVERDPNFKNAVGSWKLGVACSMLVQQVGKGVLANVPKLAQDTVETLVQTAFASMIASA
jgi:hypothetical protein